jgi:DNA-binding ferritin-like protein (Dps family)
MKKLLKQRMKERAEDMKFMAKVFNLITNYAHKNGMSADETLRRVAKNILDMLEIATFDGDEHEGF